MPPHRWYPPGTVPGPRSAILHPEQTRPRARRSVGQQRSAARARTRADAARVRVLLARRDSVCSLATLGPLLARNRCIGADRSRAGSHTTTCVQVCTRLREVVRRGPRLRSTSTSRRSVPAGSSPRGPPRAVTCATRSTRCARRAAPCRRRLQPRSTVDHGSQTPGARFAAGACVDARGHVRHARTRQSSLSCPLVRGDGGRNSECGRSSRLLVERAVRRRSPRRGPGGSRARATASGSAARVLAAP